MSRNILSNSYIDGREFTGVVSGPLGFTRFASQLRQPIGYLGYLIFPLNQWLADGLLVSSTLNSAVQAHNSCYSCSCTVALSFIL